MADAIEDDGQIWIIYSKEKPRVLTLTAKHRKVDRVAEFPTIGGHTLKWGHYRFLGTD